MSAEPKPIRQEAIRSLAYIIADWIGPGVVSERAAEALIADGWVSPEEHAAALDDLHEGVDQVNRVSALAADLQRRGDSEGARLIFAALNGERA